MLNQLKIILLFFKKFGLIHGLKLYIQFSLGYTNQLVIPGFKYKINLRKNTTDIKSFKRILLAAEYDINIPFEPKVIVDAGANIGLFSLIIKNRYPDVKIICIEPDPGNFEVLKSNLSSYSDIYFVNKALWYENAGLYISDKMNLGEWGLIVESNQELANAKSITVDIIRELYNIDVIDLFKIDIEGSEKYLFSENYEEWLKSTRMIIIELHDWINAGSSKSFFTAINQALPSYTYFCKSESSILLNLSIYNNNNN